MRIGIDIRSLLDDTPTGVATVVHHLAETLPQIAPADTFVLFAGGARGRRPTLACEKLPNVTVVAPAIPNRLMTLLMLAPHGPGLEAFLPQEIDAWLFPNLDVVRTRLPYTLLVHDVSFHTFPQFFRLHDHLHLALARPRMLAQRAATVVGVSHATQRDVARVWGIPEDRLRVASPGVDHARYLPREQPSDRSFRAAYNLNHRPYFLVLATHEPRKNLAALAAAYALLKTQLPDAPALVLCGAPGWKHRAVARQIARHPNAPDILPLGYIPEQHKPALVRGAAALIFPSFTEGFGLPVLEAMACGTPVITANTGALPEVTGGSALLIDPWNVDDLVRAVHTLLTDPRTAVRLRREGPQQAQKYSWDTFAHAVREALQQSS